jgi:hypothetical protein
MFDLPLVSSIRYQKSCQPGGPSFAESPEKDTIRFTKTIISFVFKMTLQFRLSEITDKKVIASLEELVGFRVDKVVPIITLLYFIRCDKRSSSSQWRLSPPSPTQPAQAILLERTKRNIQIVDSTLKCKSILLYHDLADGSGVLHTHITTVLNTSMPGFVGSLLTGGSSFAASEVCSLVKAGTTATATAGRACVVHSFTEGAHTSPRAISNECAHLLVFFPSGDLRFRTLFA